MALTDKAEIARGDVIDMINVRHDYGHSNSIACAFFWELLGKQLSDDEITQYAKIVEPDEEAREAIVEDLKQWRAMQGGE